MEWIKTKDKIPPKDIIIVGCYLGGDVFVLRPKGDGDERAYEVNNTTSSNAYYMYRPPDMWFEVILPSGEEKEQKEIEDPIESRTEILDFGMDR